MHRYSKLIALAALAVAAICGGAAPAEAQPTTNIIRGPLAFGPANRAPVPRPATPQMQQSARPSPGPNFIPRSYMMSPGPIYRLPPPACRSFPA